MRLRRLLPFVVGMASASFAPAVDQNWENPVFATADEAVAAAARSLPRLEHDPPPGLELFVDLTLADGDVGGRTRPSPVSRQVVETLLFTYQTAFADNDVQRQTIERFLGAVPRQTSILEKRLARFGYPALKGMSYCRLVESVDAFANLNRASSDKMSQVGGVTYYCRYMVLPLSYVGQASIEELRRSAARNPSLDVHGTIRRWQQQSYANLVNTFRHELVHVHTNSTLDVPLYRDRFDYPTWFHEGTATYLAADPHSGLSTGYQEYQNVFFYLAQRFGVRKLQRFYASTLGGTEVRSALAEIYSIPDSEQLFRRSSRWHRTKEVIKNLFWIAAIAIVVIAFRGSDRPYIGWLQLLAAVAFAFGIATGLVEHIFGLKGPTVVLVGKVGFTAVALMFGVFGVGRIRRHRRTAGSSV